MDMMTRAAIVRAADALRIAARNDAVADRFTDLAMGAFVRSSLHDEFAVAPPEASKMREAGVMPLNGGQVFDTQRLYRDLTTSTDSATSKAGFLVQSGSVHPELRPELGALPIVFRAGARVVNLKQASAWPIISTAATAAWVAENEAPSASDPVFGNVAITERLLVAHANFGRRLEKQSLIAVDAMLVEHFRRQFSRALDAAALMGGGTNQPVGIGSTSGVASHAVGSNGGPITRSLVWGMAEDVMGSGAMTAGSAFAVIINSATARSAAKIADGDRFLFRPDPADVTRGTVADLPAYVSDSLPANLTKGSASGVCSAVIAGDFSQLVVPMMPGFEALVDRFTYARSGAVRVIGFLGCDVALLEPTAFACCKDVTTP